MSKKRFYNFIRSPYLWAIVVRALLLVLVPRITRGDAADYVIIAQNLAEGRGFAKCTYAPFHLTATRPPLFVFVLAGAFMAGLRENHVLLLNGLFDLLTIYLAKKWAEESGFKWAKFAPWVIALCPLLITYSVQPTSENISVFLFFAALLFTLRRKPIVSGALWGLLSLARSYFLLFPAFLWVFKPSLKWSRKQLTVMVAASLVFPGAWMVRNYVALGQFAFSQSNMASWQIYQGVCVANFDWWREEHVQSIMNFPPMARFMSGQCVPDSHVKEWDLELREHVVKCVWDNPFGALRNFVIKEMNLFINWGQIMPYNRIPFFVIGFINSLMFLFWVIAIRTSWKARSSSTLAPGLRNALRISWLSVFYVFVFTTPFALDARYLLGPVLALAIVTLELTQGPFKLGRWLRWGALKRR